MNDIETRARPKKTPKRSAAAQPQKAPAPQETLAPAAALVLAKGAKSTPKETVVHPGPQAGKRAAKKAAMKPGKGKAAILNVAPTAPIEPAMDVSAVAMTAATPTLAPAKKPKAKPSVKSAPAKAEAAQPAADLFVPAPTKPAGAAKPAALTKSVAAAKSAVAAEKPIVSAKPVAPPRRAAPMPVAKAPFTPAAASIAQMTPAPALEAAPLVMAQPLAPPVAAKAKPAQEAPQPGDGSMPMPDFTALSQNLARLVEQGGKAAAAYMKPYEEGKTNPDLAEHVEDAVKTFGHVAEHWISDPKRAIEAQTSISAPMLELWSRTLRKMSGEETEPVKAPDPTDKRFADPEWNRNPIYDFLRQAYVITTDWANDLVARADTLEPFEREKAGFYLRQIAGAVSPSNFIATNPELLRTTLAQSGENLVRGMQMFTEDLEAGKGQLKIRQSDASKFVLGRDMAATPGKVILRNDLMELIQYAPTTETVLKRPLLIVPPWINKFYVLDLNPEKSFIRWAVAQGLTVFVISWVNPDERHADKSFEDYMREGVIAALETIETVTGERQVSTVGYCVGGTLLAIALAWLAAKGDDRIASSTFLTTQVDFRDAGDLKLFVDQVRIKAIEEKMRETGYLEGSKMATAFNMLRPNELIWSYVVNNYLKGKEPMPFDLLAWNSDSTRMPAANHSFYLRNCYLENNLTQGRLDFAGEKLDLRKVKIPVYHLATKEDHIAPARSVYTGAGYFGGAVRYVLAGSGHIAGVVNPVGKPKYQFWAGPPVTESFDDWLKDATETPGTWWSDWIGWLTAQAPERVPARQPGGGKLEPICDAPGEYVRVKA